MKLILAAVLAIALPCGAAVLGTAKNALGGEIKLTDEESQCGGTTRKITTSNGQTTIEGCWKQIDEKEDTIMVYWPEVGIYFYPRSEFKSGKTQGWL